jgi:hypothetical protein
MRDDARARRSKKAESPDNPRLQRPGWVRGTREARPSAGRIVAPRVELFAPIALPVYTPRIARQFHQISRISNR